MSFASRTPKPRLYFTERPTAWHKGLPPSPDSTAPAADVACHGTAERDVDDDLLGMRNVHLSSSADGLVSHWTGPGHSM